MLSDAISSRLSFLVDFGGGGEVTVWAGEGGGCALLTDGLTTRSNDEAAEAI